MKCSSFKPAFVFSSCALHSNPISPDLQFLRIQLEGIEFRVGFAQLLSEQRLIARPFSAL